MTQYSTLNVKLSNSKLNRLESAIKNGTEVTSNLSPNLIESSNDETNFPRKLLTNIQVLLINSVLKSQFSYCSLIWMF